MSKISKSIVISEFLWLLFFAVVFLKFDYTRTTLAVVNAIALKHRKVCSRRKFVKTWKA